MKVITPAELREHLSATKHLPVPAQFDHIAEYTGVDLRWASITLAQKAHWLDLMANAPSSDRLH